MIGLILFGLAGFWTGAQSAATPVQRAPTVPFPLQNSGAPLSIPATFDALTICEPQGRGPSIERRSQGDERKQQFEVEKIKVLSSTYLASGLSATVLVPWQQVSPVALPVGRRVLLVATKPRDGYLGWPTVIGQTVPRYELFRSGSPSEVFGLAYLETTQGQLPADERPEWQLLAALAGCIPGTSDENVIAIAKFMRCEPPPGADSFQLSLGHEPDAYYELFASAVAAEAPYHRALIFNALNVFAYYGSGDRYEQAVRESASDPGAFPNGVGSPRFWEEASGSAPRKYVKHHRYLDFQTVDAIVASKNPRISVYLLLSLGGDKPPVGERDLLSKLDDPDPELRWNIVSALARWHKDPAHSPQAPLRPAGRSEVSTYPGLDQAVSYWKAYLKKQ